MLSLVSQEGIFEQLVRSFVVDMDIPVALGDSCRSASDDEALPALIEDLRRARVDFGTIEGLVETDADEAAV